MWNFFALMILMGLVKYPKTSDYWSRYFLYHDPKQLPELYDFCTLLTAHLLMMII
jgi:hypothetical protein